MLVLGLGGAAFSIATGKGLSVEISGMSLAAIAGILLNLLIPDEESEIEEKIDTKEDSKKIKEEAISKIDELKKAIKEELTIELKDELLDEIKSELDKDNKSKRGKKE